MEAISKAIGTSYRLNRRQAEVSVTAYLKMLAERSLLALQSPAKSGAAKPAGAAKQQRKRAA